MYQYDWGEDSNGSHTPEFPWIDIIILDAISRSYHFDILESRDCAHHSFLYLFRDAA